MTRTSISRYSLTEGELLPSLLEFALPLMCANLLQSLYGATDLVVVGQFADSASVSAVATGSQVMQTITGIITGLTTGGTILIGRLIGAKKGHDAASTVGTIIVLFSAIALALTAVMLFATRGLASLMRAPTAAFGQTVSYIFICSVGIVFITGYNAVSGIMRGLGDSRLPLLFVAIAAIVNIFGDLLLVAVFHMAAAGAAIATVASQAISMSLAIGILRRKGLPFEFHRCDIGLEPRMARELLRLGSPIAMQDAMTNVSFLVITAIINSLGLIQSAAVGVIEKLMGFAMLPPFAFMAAIAAFTAQNMGARQPERARKAMYYGMAATLVFGTAVCVFSQFSGATLVRLFSKDAAVVAAGADYLRSYSIDCVLVCFVFSLTGFLNGCGKTLFVMAQSLAATFLVRIPVSYFMSKRPGATMYDIGFAAPAASLLGLTLCLLYMKSGNWRPAAH